MLHNRCITRVCPGAFCLSGTLLLKRLARAHALALIAQDRNALPSYNRLIDAIQEGITRVQVFILS